MDNTINLYDLLPNISNLGSFPETASDLSASFVAILVAVFAVFVLISIYSLIKALTRVKWLKRNLKSETSTSVVVNRFQIREKAHKTGNRAGHLWSEFDETLVEAHVGDEVHLHNIYDADHFFNNSTLAGEITESRMLAAVPGFLTALGVIGTFVGLQLGLSGLHIGNGAEIAEMKDGLAEVINGAKIAFMTSVWGVFLSVAFNFIEKFLESIAKKSIGNIQNRIDDLFPRFSAEFQLKKIADDGHQSRESLQGLAEKIGEKMQESLVQATEGIQKGLESSLEKIMAPAINKLVEETSDGSQKALEQLVEKFLAKFGEQGQEQRQAMDDASKGIENAVAAMSVTLSEFMRKINESQSNSEQREKELITQIAGQVNELVGQSRSHYGKLVEANAEAQGKQAEREKELKGYMSDALAKIAEHMKKHAQASDAIIEQGKALQNQTAVGQENLKEISTGIMSGAQQLEQVVTQLQQFAESIRSTSNVLGTSIKEAAESSRDLSKYNQELASRFDLIQQNLSSSISQLGEINTRLDQTINTADNTFNNLKTHQQNYLQSLQDNVQQLANQGAKLIKDYSEQANAQTKEHLGIWAEHTTQYAAQMNRAAESLAGIVEDIDDKLGRK